MPTFRGVGERMKARLRAIGYTKANGDLDVQRFVLDHRYPTALFYDWLGDRRTPIKDLERLAKDLETSPPFLLFGVDAPAVPAVRSSRTRAGASKLPRRAISGGSDGAGSDQAHYVTHAAQPSCVIDLAPYRQRRRSGDRRHQWRRRADVAERRLRPAV